MQLNTYTIPCNTIIEDTWLIWAFMWFQDLTAGIVLVGDKAKTPMTYNVVWIRAQTETQWAWNQPVVLINSSALDRSHYLQALTGTITCKAALTLIATILNTNLGRDYGHRQRTLIDSTLPKCAFPRKRMHGIPPLFICLAISSCHQTWLPKNGVADCVSRVLRFAHFDPHLYQTEKRTLP